jgi:hypothetical protein
MERTSTTSINLAGAGLGALFVWNVIRAATQSVTPGEAWNYDRYIAPGWTQALSAFDGNNHVLNTLLVRISTARIHVTDLALRAPSLLFGALYMAAAYRIARRWFGGGAMFLAVLGLLTLNPLVVDAMSEARGYGMALACWMWALLLVSGTPAGAAIPRARACAAGILLGLSVVASLSFAAPATALLLVAAWRHRLDYMPHMAGLTAFVLLTVPLNHADASVVTQGATSLRQTLNELTDASFGLENSVAAAAARIAAGLLAIVGLWVGLRRRVPAIVYLTGGSLAAAFGLLLAAHRWAHAAFPESGALYLIPLITLFVAGLVWQSKRDPAQITFLVLSALCVAHYADHLRLPYRAAAGLAGGRAMAQSLRDDAGQRDVRIAADGDAEAVMRYYKERYRQPNWHTIETPKPDASYDYYVFAARDAETVDRRGLQVIYRDAGLILAR